MKLEVKKIDALKREMRFEIPREKVTEVLEEVYRDMAKVAKVKGFRPGKVPRHVLETEHGALAREEAVKKIIPEAYREGVRQADLSPLDLPEITDVDFKDGVVTFKAQVDIRPEIKIKNYKGIAIKRKSSDVTDEEIKKTMEYFQKSQGKDQKTEVDDTFAKGLGFPNLEAFKKSLVTQMQLEKERQNRLDVENQIVDALLSETKFAVPQNFVQRQLEQRLNEARRHMESQGAKEEDIMKRLEELRPKLKDPTERDVKVFLIFDKIAEMESLEIKEGENLPNKVMEFLLKEAQWQEEKK